MGLHSSGHIGYLDFCHYVKMFSGKTVKKVLLNHGDLKSSLAIYPLLAEQGLSSSKYLILEDKQYYNL